MSTTTNNYEPAGDTVRSATAVRWMRPADLPAHLGDALVPAEGVDEAPIWGAQMPDPDALEAAVQRAERTVGLQDTDALARAKSPADLEKDLAAARIKRDLRRDVELEQAKARIAEEQAAARHAQRLAELRRKAAEAAAEARAEAEKVANPWHEVVRVWRARTWLPLFGAIPAVFSLVAGAVNVGSQLHRIFPGVPLISWVIDPIISVLIVVIGAAHLYEATTTRDGRPVFRWVEVFLFALTSVAAVGLHYVDGPGDDAAGAAWGDVGPLIWLAVPIGLGVSMWAVPKLRTNLTERLRTVERQARAQETEEARKTSSDGVLPTPSDLHGKNPDKSSSRAARRKQREEVTATIPAPSRTSLESHRATLRDLASRGEIDPATTPVNTVAKRLGCRWERARDLLAELATENQPTTCERTGEHA